MSRILIVEDEQHLAEGLRFNLEAEGYQVDVAETGEIALDCVRVSKPPVDLIVLDIMLPGIDGFQVASALRESGRYLPILMLTARGHSEDILHGFEAGADDYLPKPFDLPILTARIRSLLRRGHWMRPQPARSDVYAFEGKTVDFENLEIKVGDRALRLTLMEASLLRHLIANDGKVVSRKTMLEEIWGVHEDTDTRAIDNFIVRLRKYIEAEPAQPRHLITVRGVGYKFMSRP